MDITLEEKDLAGEDNLSVDEREGIKISDLLALGGLAFRIGPYLSEFGGLGSTGQENER